MSGLLFPAYGSTVLRAPQRPLLGGREGPSLVVPSLPVVDDLTADGPIGERIIVTGRVLSEGRPVVGALVEVWQANAAGRYAHDADRHAAPLDPGFSGVGRCYTDAAGRYRFVTIKPGAYPWTNRHGSWRPAHIHFSVLTPRYGQRLVTQMYFPGDPLLAQDPILDWAGDRAGLLVARFDSDVTEPEWALGYTWDIQV